MALLVFLLLTALLQVIWAIQALLFFTLLNLLLPLQFFAKLIVFWASYCRPAVTLQQYGLTHSDEPLCQLEQLGNLVCIAQVYGQKRLFHIDCSTLARSPYFCTIFCRSKKARVTFCLYRIHLSRDHT